MTDPDPRRTRRRPALPRVTPTLAAAGACLLAAASSCSNPLRGNSHPPGAFEPRRTHVAIDFFPTFELEGRYFVWLGLESNTGPNGRDLNGDGDFQDEVAQLVDMAAKRERNLRVAAVDFEILGDHVFLVVSEDLDGRDWSGDGFTNDLVLLHFSAGRQVAFVSTLAQSTGPKILEVGDRLYFTDVPVLPLVAPDTTVNYVTQAQPLIPVRLQNVDALNTADPYLVAADEGLVFLSRSEQREGRDLNGDLDLTDENVLALVDGTDPAGLVRGVGLAVGSINVPVRALATGPGDWLVGFLVDEGDQGAVNLNDPLLFDPAWQPSSCAGLGDTDADDQILFFLQFAPWLVDPVASPPVNTGVPGRLKVLAVPGTGGSPGFVATISFEQDEGDCSYNFVSDDEGDDDQDDAMVRWVEASLPVRPLADVDLLVASTQTPGGALGVSDMFGRLVATLSEFSDSRDHDGNPFTSFGNLVAWIDPNDGSAATWVFDHGTAGNRFAGATWMREERDQGRLLMGFSELVFGTSLNTSDSDIGDDVAVFARFDPDDPDDLDFPGPPIATVSSNPGIVITDKFAFYRVSENANNRKYNGDKDFNDVVLGRTRLDDPRRSVQIGVTLENNFGGNDPQITLLGASRFGCAWQASEVRDRRDWNGDGDLLDFALRWMTFD